MVTVFTDINTSLRLVGGATPFEGRLEVEHEGIWGSVCGLNFTDSEAQAVCSNLGLQPNG